jgi:hypothetical protein
VTLYEHVKSLSQPCRTGIHQWRWSKGRLVYHIVHDIRMVEANSWLNHTGIPLRESSSVNILRDMFMSTIWRRPCTGLHDFLEVIFGCKLKKRKGYRQYQDLGFPPGLVNDFSDKHLNGSFMKEDPRLGSVVLNLSADFIYHYVALSTETSSSAWILIGWFRFGVQDSNVTNLHMHALICLPSFCIARERCLPSQVGVAVRSCFDSLWPQFELLL